MGIWDVSRPARTFCSGSGKWNEIMPKRNTRTPTSRGLSRSFRTAHKQLERSLILDVVEEALSAESGSKTYGFENIKGVGISEKLVNGWLTSDPCVTVYVAAKAPLTEIREEARVPEKVGAVPTDVVEIGEIEAFPFKGRYRPAPGGVSVGHFNVTAGTIGCLVKKGEVVCVLSNNHVLADVNQGKPGDAIVQPGPYDGGQVPADQIGKLTTFVPIDFTKPNTVDCAIAEVQPTVATALNKAIKEPESPPSLKGLAFRDWTMTCF